MQSDLLCCVDSYSLYFSCSIDSLYHSTACYLLIYPYPDDPCRAAHGPLLVTPTFVLLLCATDALNLSDVPVSELLTMR